MQQAPVVPINNKWLGKARGGAQTGSKLMGNRAKIGFAVLAIVTLGVATFGLLRPEAARIKDAKAQTVTAEALSVQLRAQLKHLEALKQNAPALTEQAKKFDQALPAQVELASFILQVQHASDMAHLDWLSTNPTPPVAAAGDPPGVMEAPTAMTAEGSYPAIQDFVARLEGLDRALKITAIDLSGKSDGTTGPAKLSAKLMVKMFVASAAPAPAPVQSGATVPSQPVAPATAGPQGVK